MNESDIIREWRSGLTVMQVANLYMKSYNEKDKRRREPKITENEALAHVEPVIFEYETRDWRKKAWVYKQK